MKTESKTGLRKKFREIRKKIPPAYREEASNKAATIFLQDPFFKKSEHIACYLPVLDEFNSLPIVEAIWGEKKFCYLPILEKENILNFVRYKYGDALHLNRYNILEPINKTKTISPKELDIVIMPLIAFDRYGRRLGTGGGFFDKTFAFIKDHQKLIEERISGRVPHMVGLGFIAQEAQNLPEDPWDILLERVLTEEEMIICRSLG